MFESSSAAERAFYDAFERQDITSMRRVWAEDEAVCCVHPMWPRILGHGAIVESWARIFAHDAQMSIRFEVQQRMISDTIAIHYVDEHFGLRHEPASHRPVLATNVYRRTGSGWLMTLHHASPSPAEKRPERFDTVH